jgi:hypothetical protein
MGERVDVRGADIRVGREVGRSGEERVRIATFVPAGAVIVLIRIGMRVPDVVVARKVERSSTSGLPSLLSTTPSVNAYRSKPLNTVWLDGPSMVT